MRQLIAVLLVLLLSLSQPIAFSQDQPKYNFPTGC